MYWSEVWIFSTLSPGCTRRTRFYMYIIAVVKLYVVQPNYLHSDAVQRQNLRLPHYKEIKESKWKLLLFMSSLNGTISLIIELFICSWSHKALRGRELFTCSIDPKPYLIFSCPFMCYFLYRRASDGKAIMPPTSRQSSISYASVLDIP